MFQPAHFSNRLRKTLKYLYSHEAKGTVIGTKEDSIKTDVSDLHLFLINGRIMSKPIRLLKLTNYICMKTFCQLS